MASSFGRVQRFAIDGCNGMRPACPARDEQDIEKRDAKVAVAAPQKELLFARGKIRERERDIGAGDLLADRSHIIDHQPQSLTHDPGDRTGQEGQNGSQAMYEGKYDSIHGFPAQAREVTGRYRGNCSGLSDGNELTFGQRASNIESSMKFSSPIRSLLYAAIALWGTEAAGQVYVVPIQGTIDLGLPPYVERVIALAAKEQPDLIIFDIDTFGGRVDGATRIKDAIMESTVPTIAFINRRAISAGALISLACEQIIMTSGATIGAATAVSLEGKKASEKVISYMREEMSATAEARGRPSRLAEAMVDEDLKIEWLVVRGDTVFLTDVEGSKEGKLVTLTTEKAIRLGIADGTFETIEELLIDRDLQSAAIITFAPSWSEKLVRFLTDPVVSSLLMTLGFMGLIFEVKSPGFGVGGIIGVAALPLFFGASFLAELATITEVLFFLTGLILILLEVFVIPGFGVAGISGIGLMLWGMFKMLLGEYPTPDQIERAFLGLNIGIVGAILAAIVMLRLLLKSRFFQKNVPISSEDYSISVGLDVLVGLQGVTLTRCLPSGKANIGGRQINVMTRGESLDKGAPVEVISVESNVALVRAVDNPSQET